MNNQESFIIPVLFYGSPAEVEITPHDNGIFGIKIDGTKSAKIQHHKQLSGEPLPDEVLESIFTQIKTHYA